MQRIVRLRPEHLIGRHIHRHAGAFHGDADIIEAAVVQQPDVTHGAVHQRLRRDAAVLGQQVFFQRPAVDADADGDAPLPAGVRHGPHPLLAADIAGIDADLVDAALGAQQRQLVVKMDIRHQRDVDTRLDGWDSPRRLLRGDCHTDDLAPRLLQPEDLLHRGLHILCGGIAHGLDAHRCAAAYGHAAYHDLLTHRIPPQCISFHTSLNVMTAISASSSTSPAKWM